jgi:hypothetical protein
MFSRNKIIHGLFDLAPGLFSLFLPKKLFLYNVGFSNQRKALFIGSDYFVGLIMQNMSRQKVKFGWMNADI